jgi:DNA repair photolyase
MILKEIHSKTILSASKVYDYVINPYVGCEHGCQYCYARFIKKFTGHKEPWGQFVDVKVNAPDLLLVEVKKKRCGKVWVSGLCDPYQPLEAEYKLTRRCLEILADNGWPVVVQTRSPLVLRDLDVLQRGKNFEVGLTITTADDEVRKLFEPDAPPIDERINALDKLHRAGITTYAMIAPILPGAEHLVDRLSGKVDYIIVDRMNYSYANRIYKEHGLDDYLSDSFFRHAGEEIANACQELGISCMVAF